MKPKTKFKQTEIGMIPEEWEVKQVKEFCVKITSGGTPSRKKEEYWIDGTIPWLKTQELQDKNIYSAEEKITQKGLENSSAKLFPVNTILMAMYGATVGKLGILKIEATTNQAFCAMIVNPKIADYRFLFYSLLEKRDELMNLASGAAQQNLNQDIIKEFKLSFPPLPEQRAIAKILSDLDSKIELNQQMNKTLEAIGQALFKHWFVDFEFPNEQGKPYKSSGGEMVYNEELGKKVPKGWGVGRLGDFVDVVKGCSYKSDDLKESNMALVTLKSINRGGGFNQEGYKEFVGEYNEEQIVKDGEIVVAQTDLTQKAEVVGRPAIVNSLGRYAKLIASLDLQIVRPKNNFSRNYLYYLLMTEDFHNHALSYTGGTTVLHLNKNAVPEFLAIIPSKEILDKFDEVIMFIQNKVAINESESFILSQIRDSLLPKLMSGKIRVPVEVRA